MLVTTSVHYENVIGWKKVRAYLRGIWYDANESLNLTSLIRQIWILMKLKLLEKY